MANESEPGMLSHDEVSEETLRRHNEGIKATEERFLNAEEGDDEGWKSEALGIIKDVRKFVKHISISASLPCDENGIYMNLETKEGLCLTIELSSAGFRVCGHQFDTLTHSDDQPNDKQMPLDVYYETPYALLGSISPGYRDCFSSELAERLQALCQ